MKLQHRGSFGFHSGARAIAFFTALLAALPLLPVRNALAWELDGIEWYGPTIKGLSDAEPGSYSSSGSSGASSFVGTQQVYFDFDSQTIGTEHVYTVAERDSIVAGVAAIYAPWDFTFSHTVVPTGTYATLIFNSGSAGGLASDIDFRNPGLGGSAQINVNTLVPSPTSANFIALSTTIGAHELGHLVGLRHADSLGPIGRGVAPTKPNIAAYEPDYPGLVLANETPVHTMASPASVGQTIAQAIAGTHLGERSAVKLEFNEVGTVTPEIGAAHSTPATAQLLTLPTFPVPNTAISGDLNFGKNLFADAEVITGNISVSLQQDYYQFSGTAGDIINAEVISTLPGRFGSNDIDPMIQLFGPDGTTVVTQGAGTAFNDDDFESQEATLIDVVLPVTGTFFVQVTPFGSGDTGNYELYLYRFRAVTVPEPAALSLLFVAALMIGGSNRRSWMHGAS